jgi:hypothetical protein
VVTHFFQFPTAISKRRWMETKCRNEPTCCLCHVFNHWKTTHVAASLTDRAIDQATAFSFLFRTPAEAGNVLLWGTHDTKLFHLVCEARPVQAQAGGRSASSSNDPVALTERLQNQLSFDLLQGTLGTSGTGIE